MISTLLRRVRIALLIAPLGLLGCGDSATNEPTDTAVAPAPTPTDTAPSPSAPAPAPTESAPEAKTETAASPEAAAVQLTPLKYEAFKTDVATNPGAKYTLVDAWATWCGPCKENFPHLIAMHQKYADRGLAVVSLSFDNPADSKAVEEANRFLKEQKAAFKNVLLDEEEGTAFDLFDVNGIPAVFLYGPDGKEIRRFTMDNPDRQFTYDQVEQVVQTLLDGKELPADAPGEVYKPRQAEKKSD